MTATSVSGSPGWEGLQTPPAGAPRDEDPLRIRLCPADPGAARHAHTAAAVTAAPDGDGDGGDGGRWELQVPGSVVVGAVRTDQDGPAPLSEQQRWEGTQRRYPQPRRRPTEPGRLLQVPDSSGDRTTHDDRETIVSPWAIFVVWL